MKEIYRYNDYIVYLIMKIENRVELLLVDDFGTIAYYKANIEYKNIYDFVNIDMNIGFLEDYFIIVSNSLKFIK